MKRFPTFVAIFWTIAGPAILRADCPCETNSDSGAPTKASAPLATGSSAQGDRPKYLDPEVPIELRVEDLLPRLTLDEKILELEDDWGSKAIPRLKIPALLKTE